MADNKENDKFDLGVNWLRNQPPLFNCAFSSVSKGMR